MNSQQRIKHLEDLVLRSNTCFEIIKGYMGSSWFELDFDIGGMAAPDDVAKEYDAIHARREPPLHPTIESSSNGWWRVRSFYGKDSPWSIAYVRFVPSKKEGRSHLKAQLFFKDYGYTGVITLRGDDDRGLEWGGKIELDAFSLPPAGENEVKVTFPKQQTEESNG